MKRTLITTSFLAVFGMALAGPPVDLQLVCGATEDAPIVGVANLVEDQLHLALIAGALEACTEGVYGVVDGAKILTLSYSLADGAVTDLQVAFAADPDYAPTLTYMDAPRIAIENQLAAERNRVEALEQAERAREQARARVDDPIADPTTDAPGARDQDRDRDQDQDRDQDLNECQDACDGEAFGGPPADKPAPGTPRHE